MRRLIALGEDLRQKLFYWTVQSKICQCSPMSVAVRVEMGFRLIVRIPKLKSAMLQKLLLHASNLFVYLLCRPVAQPTEQQWI